MLFFPENRRDSTCPPAAFSKKHSSSTMARMFLVVLLFPLQDSLAVVPHCPFPGCSSMSNGGRWSTCAHCAALEIATTALKKIQNSCSCKLPPRRVDYLFRAEEDPSDFSALDCEEGLRSSTGSCTSSSEGFWDAEFAMSLATPSTIPRSVLSVATERFIYVTRSVFFRRWCWYWPLLRVRLCLRED